MQYPTCMIGGGIGSMIGTHHRLAAKESGFFTIVAACFSQTIDKTKSLASKIGIPDERCYGNWKDMLDTESKKIDGARVVIIVTPDDQHFAQAKYALELNLHVVCDKPVSITASEALVLKKLAQKKKLLFGITFTQSGNPALIKAKKLLQSNTLGNIRRVQAHFHVPWAIEKIEDDINNPSHKQAVWRLNKEFGTCAISDLGSHALHYMHDISQLLPSSLVADIGVMVKGRKGDDTTNIMLKYDNYKGNIGVTGMLSLSYAMTSTTEWMSFEYLCDKGGIKCYTPPGTSEWYLAISRDGKIEGIESFLGDGKSIEEYPGVSISTDSVLTFANLYIEFGNAIRAAKVSDYSSYPSIQHGYEGMVIIVAAKESSEKRKWVSLKY